MTSPRDVQDYEAQALKLFRSLVMDEALAVPVIADALRAESRAALERAAQEAEALSSNYDKERAEIADSIADAIRALIAPAPESPLGPAAEDEPPYWRIGRHYGIHVYCGDTPIATFHTVEAAQAAVRAYNASLDRSEPAPSKEPPP